MAARTITGEKTKCQGSAIHASPLGCVCVFTLIGTSNYFRGKREDRKSKDLVQNTALSSSSWGELVSCEIISMKRTAGRMHSPDNGQGQKGSSSTGGRETCCQQRVKAAAPSRARLPVHKGYKAQWGREGTPTGPLLKQIKSHMSISPFHRCYNLSDRSESC